ncbi:carbohydrate binding domain-containing protein [uncultured Ruminococcus sp.]|uniref:carbohydrate binding domain-containing protein n=1 Tax=uncultured Ruminococcus sp. TaxID=165186 RepID=UPI0026167802|nr:carbohydrate binding domain-containing protein [uncultured Ruminococcus sp.]
MKNYIDGFYELIHKNSLKRRRMVSLLLVLSMFVSSGVLWGLHDTGITMVNEELCGIAEHTHTDECYEDVLVCGLEEGEEHTHTAECYERRLVCGMEEHIHNAVCLGAEETIDETADDDIFALGGSVEYIDENEGESEEILLTDLPDLTLDNEIELFADGDLPPTVSTIDNIAEGIKFTLFDYGDSNLESQNNNYGYHWDADNNVWTHPNVNTTDGINAGRNAQQDILFLAYGTPVDRQCGDPNVHNTNVPVYELDENGNQKLDDNGNPIVIGYRVTDYLPDKNSYSGDYNSTPVYSGNRPVSGIVDNTLTNGYPTVNADGHHSLDYLFNDDNLTDSNGNIYKTVYTDVNHLLQKNKTNNHLFYNSNDNYAYFNTDTSEFDVYNKTYEIINDNHHKKDDVNNIRFDSNENPIVYSEDKDPGFMIGFFPFDQYDESRRDPNFDGNGFNHHFGMKMEAKFVNPSPENLENGDPVAFKYSGDDDMWVFVDGKLVLDIGGIHEPTGGMIDFTNGLVWIQDNERGETMNTIKQGYTDAQWNALPKPIGTDTSSTSQGSGNKWIVTPLTNYLGDNWDALVDGKKQPHEIKMFYLERGGCYSNLAMEMNLPTLKPLTVKKEVDYQDHLVKDPAIDNKEYEFQVWEWVKVNSDPEEWEWVKPNLPGTEQGYFTLRDGRRMTFEDLEQHRQFKIVEVGVDPNIYDQVSVNGGTSTLLNPGGGNADISSSEDPVALSTTNSYIFNNRVIQETTKIKVKKDWVDPENKKPADFTMKYKIMRTDSATGEVKQIALRYEVTDPDTHETTIKKRRTFLLRPDEQLNGKTIDDLLARYGNHIYSYKVEELNVPMNFKASYSETTEIVDGKEISVLQVTNTDISKSDIFVRKEWENTPPEGQPPVKLVLRREMVGYHPSAKTNLKVNLIDEGKNPIASKTFNDVYANGSAEIICELPEGVILYRADEEYCPAVQKTPDQLVAKYEDDENILVVKNLAPLGNDPDAIANEVTLKLLTYNAEDELLLVHHSFTRNTDGWDANSNDHTISYDSGDNNTQAYAKSDSLVVSGRDKSWHGARLYLDPAKFKMNKTYTFSTYVYHEAGETIPFKFTFNDGLNKDDNRSFKQISQEDVPSGQWTQLTGTITLPAEIDPYNMYIIVETADPGDQAPRVSEFRIDEFTAIEGTATVSVSQQTMNGNTMTDPGGAVTVELPNEVALLNDTFANDKCGWQNHYDATVDWDSNYGGSIQISRRGGSYAGAEKSLAGLGLVAGQEYTFSTYLAPSNNNETFKITLYNPNVSNSYLNVATFTMTEGGSYEKKYTIPNDINPDNYYVYIETDSGNSNFGVYAFGIRQKVVPTLKKISGYDESTGKYVSNYSNYTMEIDENSITTPLRLDNNGEYSPDTGFSKEITLPIADDATVEPKNKVRIDGVFQPLMYHWDKASLGEQNGYLYRYWIEEVKIGDETIATDVVLNGDEKTVVSEHNDYLISYDRQFVATNTENSPILVTNKYIWYKLPATGGRGTTGIYVLGAALTAIGLFSGCAVNRRRRRRD